MNIDSTIANIIRTTINNHVLDVNKPLAITLFTNKSSTGYKIPVRWEVWFKAEATLKFKFVPFPATQM